MLKFTRIRESTNNAPHKRGEYYSNPHCEGDARSRSWKLQYRQSCDLSTEPDASQLRHRPAHRLPCRDELPDRPVSVCKARLLERRGATLQDLPLCNQGRSAQAWGREVPVNKGGGLDFRNMESSRAPRKSSCGPAWFPKLVPGFRWNIILTTRAVHGNKELVSFAESYSADA